MKKIILLILILSLFVTTIEAWEKTSLGPNLVIESLTLNPYPVQQGETFELTFKVRNSHLSKTIKYPKFWIEERYPFTSLTQPKVKVLESLAPNEETLITFKLKVDKNAVITANDLIIKFQENIEGQGYSPIYLSDPIKIDVKFSGIELSIASLETIPEEIYPGDEAQLKLIIKNNLPIIMKNLDISFNFEAEPFTPLGTTSQRTLTALNKGSQKEFFFDIAVDAEAEPKVHKTTLNINYEDEFGNDYNINTTTGIKVSTKPEIQLDIEKTEIYKTAASGKVTIRISNTGLADLKFLTIKLQPSKDYDVISSEQVYIGNLESDDYETVEFDIYTKSRVKKLPLELLLIYRDSFNKEHERDEIVYLPLYSEFQLSRFGLKQGGALLKIIFYILIISFIYLSFREWRKTRDLPLALKKALRILLVKIKRIIKSIRPKTLNRAINATIKFFKEP